VILSLAYHTVPELSAPEMVTVAAAAGCTHVGLRLLGGRSGYEALPVLGDASVRRETVARLHGTGLGLLDASTARLTPEAEPEAFLRMLDGAAELGAPAVMANGDDPEPARLADRLGGLCDAAAARGLEVRFEFVSWSCVPDLAHAVRLARALARPNLSIVLDALHHHRAGGTPADIAAAPAHLLGCFQICDAPAAPPRDRDGLIHEAVGARLLPGDGVIDLAGLLRALPRGIPVAIEVPMAALARSVAAEERVRRAVAATRRVLAAAFAPAEPMEV